MKHTPVFHPTGQGGKKHHPVTNRSRQFFEPIRGLKSDAANERIKASQSDTKRKANS